MAFGKTVNPNRYLQISTKRWSSLLKKLRKEGKINEEFEILLNNLSLEEVIAIKLELSSRTNISPLYGLPLWYSLTNIVQDAVLKFAISTTKTSSEAARFLGIDQASLYPLIKKFAILNYFGTKYRDRWLKKNLKQQNISEPL
jgi:hypothetical protein